MRSCCRSIKHTWNMHLSYYSMIHLGYETYIYQLLSDSGKRVLAIPPSVWKMALKSIVRDRQPRRQAAVSHSGQALSSLRWGCCLESGGKTNLTLRVIDWQEKKQDTNQWSKRANVQNWTTVPSHFLPILSFLFDISGLAAAFWAET